MCFGFWGKLSLYCPGALPGELGSGDHCFAQKHDHMDTSLFTAGADDQTNCLYKRSAVQRCKHCVSFP